MSSRLMVNDLCTAPAAPHGTSRMRVTSLVTRVETRVTRCQNPRYAMSEPALRDVRTGVTRCQNRRHAMYGPPLRVERLLVPDVRTPVTRGTGACSRCTDPRYAWNECLCTMSDTPLHHVRALVRRVTFTRRGGKAPLPSPRTRGNAVLTSRMDCD